MVAGKPESMMFLLAGLLAACAGGGPGRGDGALDPGALVRVTMHSQVGVLLDEIPTDMRERVTRDLLDQGPALWTSRAVFQIEHTLHRLVFRHTYSHDSSKRQLPLPPRALWNITFDAGGAERRDVGGHDMLVIGYTLDTLLLSDVASPGEAEPALAQVGGTWDEPFVLPVDPMFLFQRTGYACMDVGLQVFDESARWAFDHTCDVAGPNAGICHRAVPEPVTSSCIDALDSTVGKVETVVRFERLAWDPDLADSARASAFTNTGVSDLEPMGEALENRWLVHRYIAPDSCAVQERCVTGSGWRRLLMFDGSVRNVGGADMTIGLVEAGLGSALLEHNVFEHSDCHNHFHFRFYGDFRYGSGEQQTSKKQAFCLQSTQRHFNDERTPLTTPYDDCSFQGISAGWGDDYLAGIDCQWLDVTDFDIPGDSVTHALSFEMNPERFLCEGTPIQDDEGNQMFEPTDLVTEQGEPIGRPMCDQAEGWDRNNLAQREVEIPAAGGFIHEPCPAGALGPRRNCGFAGGTTPIACTAGETVTLACRVPDGTVPHVARWCEISDALGTGVACAYRESVATALVTETPVEVAFTCPVVRDADADAGGYSLHTAPVYSADAAGEVICDPQP